MDNEDEICVSYKEFRDWCPDPIMREIDAADTASEGQD